MPFSDKKQERSEQRKATAPGVRRPDGAKTTQAKPAPTPAKPQEPFRWYRVEGVTRRGVRYVKVGGRSGEWCIYGADGEKRDFVRQDAKSLQDVLRIGRRFIGFVPICIRELSAEGK